MNMPEDKKSASGFCHARLPNAGLGNKLFVWARAQCFARLNRLPLVVTGWTQFQLAPILHGGDLRLYLNYFRRVEEVGFFTQSRLRRSLPLVTEPAVERLAPDAPPSIYEFHAVPHWSDYFGSIKPHRELVRQSLLELLTPARQREYEAARRPQICLQVRMGDFRPLKPGEDFSKVGNVRTPVSYFVDILQGIRRLHGSQVPALIISDGNREQLSELLAIPGVELSGPQSKIVDILTMANSKILVSAASTFGFWGGFLGQSALIMHPDHLHQPIRPADVNERHYEGPAVGPAEQWPALLQQAIRTL